METIDVLLTKEQISARVKEIAQQITEYYDGKSVYAVSVLKGGAIFMIDLIKEIYSPVEINFMSVSSYGSSTESSGTITVNLDIDKDLTGKNVLFVEDIVDSGRTLNFLINLAKERNAADIKVCSLLYKPEKMLYNIDVDYVGFNIPSEFVVGYGLDYDQRYRDLKYIGILRFED